MDKTTHEIRLANWKQLIEQCVSRPKGQTIQQWLKEHGIAEKQYYYWQRKVRACEELESKGLMAPAMPKGSETVFAEIPYRREENIMPLKAPAAVIHKAGATIAVSGDIPECLLSQIMKEDETKTDMYTCLNIRFSNSRKTYSYISDDPTIETGDFVVVPSKWCDTVVEVVNVGSYEEDELPLPVNKMKKIRSVYRKRADIHYEQPQLPEQNGSLESAHISIDELLELLDGSEYEKQDCLSEEAIRRYEEKNAICLPEEYRLFIKEIGNGIRIPEPNPTLRYQNGRLQYREIYGINPKKVQAFYKYAFPFDSNGYKGELYPNCGYNTGVNIDDICLACDKRFVCPDGDEDLTGNARFHGSMVITYAGCSYAYHLILNGPYRGQVWASGDDWFVPHKKSFSEYLLWLTTADYY